MTTVKDIYIEIGKTQGLTEQEMEGVLQRACLRAPLDLTAEVPEKDRAAAISRLLGMFAVYRSLSPKQRKVLISSIEKSVRQRN